MANLDEDLPIITNDEWTACKHLCEILKPFEEMTSFVSGEKYLTGSSVIAITRCLKETCEKLQEKEYPNKILPILEKLKNGLDERFKMWRKTLHLLYAHFWILDIKTMCFKMRTELKV